MNDIKPRNPLLRIKYRYLEWQWDRVLRNSGHQHWENYFRANDPDYNPAGHTVRDQLHGYPYIAVVDYRNLDFRVVPMWGEMWYGDTVNKWCEKNCRDKFRWHWERVIQDHKGQYLPNGIGGIDELFFGFKLERDYIMFTLRWS